MFSTFDQAHAYVQQNAFQMIKSSATCGAAGTTSAFGPIDQNIFAWTDEQRKQIKPLPASLREACEALERDHGFLLAGLFTTAC
jgi:glutamine synthetase